MIQTQLEFTIGNKKISLTEQEAEELYIILGRFFQPKKVYYDEPVIRPSPYYTPTTYPEWIQPTIVCHSASTIIER